MENKELFDEIVRTYCTPVKREGEFYKNKIEEYFEGKYKKILFMRGENIISEGENNSCLYFIERGKVILARRDGIRREYCNGYLLAGEFFGFASYAGATEAFNYKALTNCNIYAVEAQHLRDYINTNASLKDYFNDVLIDTVRNITLRQGNLIMGGCRESFVKFIIEHLKDFGRVDENNDILVYLDVNLAEIALILNMTRETLSRIVSEMKRNGIIETKRRFIKIMDLARFVS